MIQENDLDQAITECMAEREPNAWTSIRLAAHFINKMVLFPDEEPQQPTQAPADTAMRYSFATDPQTPAGEITISYDSNTDFGKAIKDKPAAQIWPIIDEVMSILQTLSPQIYAAAMRHINQ